MTDSGQPTEAAMEIGCPHSAWGMVVRCPHCGLPRTVTPSQHVSDRFLAEVERGEREWPTEAGSAPQQAEPPIKGVWQISSDHELTPMIVEAVQEGLEAAAVSGKQVIVLEGIEFTWKEIRRADAVLPEPPLDVERLQMQVLRLGGVLEGFEHGVATRSSKPSDPDDVRWECLCGIGGAPKRVERHWLAELRDARLSGPPSGGTDRE